MNGNSLVEQSLGDSWAGIALLALGFAYFLGGALGYSFALRRIFARSSLLNRVTDTFVFASLILYASAFALSSLHMLQTIPRALAWGIFAPGLYWALPLGKECWRAVWPKRRLAFLVTLFVFFVRALSAAIPSQHGDPLLYHLLGPRLWTEAGGFLMHPNLPNALLASSWECLYVWPQLLWISPRPFYGLVEAQIFSQWLHLFLAWTGCGLLAMRMFRSTVKDSWLPLVGLSALFISGVQWTATLAKNDVGIAFWSLAAVIYFLETFSSKKILWALLSGFCAGLAICGKITALLSLAPILAFSLWAVWNKKNSHFTAGSLVLWFFGFLAGAIPIYLRNYFLSGDPFFPLFATIFPSPWISKSWGAHFAQVHPSSPLHALPRLGTRLPELLKETHWATGALILVALSIPLGNRFAQRFGKLAQKQILALFLGCLAAYSIFVITQAPEIELRYIGAALMILAAGGICLALKLAEFLPSGISQKFAVAILLVGALATSRLPLHLVRKIWASPLGVAFVQTHSGGEAKTWVRAHAEGRLTILAGDNETYFLTPIPVAVLTERPDLDSANDKKEFPAFVEDLCRVSHARYLVDGRPGIGVEARFGAAALAPAKVFEAQGSKVYDLRVLDPSKTNCL